MQAQLKRLPSGVPKLIMQTWKTEDMSAVWRHGQSTVLQHFPDWSYVFLTDSAMHSFVASEFPELYAGFCALPYNIQRADVLRYLWLYKHGGLYLDLDYEILRSFEPLLESLQAPLYVLYSANLSSVMTNSLIVAIPGLQCLYDLAKSSLEYSPWWFALASKHIQVMSSTGPLAFHAAIKASSVPFAVLPQSLFLPASPMLHDDLTEARRLAIAAGQAGPYTMPLDGGSWNSTDTTVINFLNRHKWPLLLMILLALFWFLLHGAHTHCALAALQRHLRRALRLQRVTTGLTETLQASLK